MDGQVLAGDGQGGRDADGRAAQCEEKKGEQAGRFRLYTCIQWRW